MQENSEDKATIGILLRQAGVISIQELTRAVYLAHKNNLPLGRVFTMLGLIRHRTLLATLLAQNLIRQNLLKPELAQRALKICHEQGSLLAQSLQDLGWEGDVERNDYSLEEILIDAGILTHKNVEDAMGLAKHLGMPVARVINLQGLASPQLLAAADKAQNLLRQGLIDREQAIVSLNSAIPLLDLIGSTGSIRPAKPFIRLEELLMLAGLITDQDILRLQSQQTNIVESKMFGTQLIGAAINLLSAIANYEMSPIYAAKILRLVFERSITLKQAMDQQRKLAQSQGEQMADMDNQPLSLYYLLRLSGLVTAFDLKRLGQLPYHKLDQQTSLEERLIKLGIINKQALDAAKRCHLLYRENFMSMEQAMIILHQWSWTGEGFTRVLEKLQWEDGKRLPTLKALAFRN